MDPAGQLLDVAHCIAASEDEVCCTFFLSQVREATGVPYRTITSDAGTALDTSVSAVFPEARHYICTEHLLRGLSVGARMKRVVQQDFPLLRSFAVRYKRGHTQLRQYVHRGVAPALSAGDGYFQFATRVSNGTVGNPTVPSFRECEPP